MSSLCRYTFMATARSFKNIVPAKRLFPLRGEGWVNYRQNSCTLELPPDIGSFYRSLLPKYIWVNIPNYSAHITIVREWERPNEEFLDRPYDGYYFPFTYSGKIYSDGTYFFLKCDSKMVRQMREEFGLIPYRKDGCLHITIANCKGR